MNPLLKWKAVAFACLLTLLAGCDSHPVATVSTRVTLDVRPLFTSLDSAAEVCTSAAEVLVLSVRGSDGKQTTYRQTLTLEETMLRINVEAAPGEASFEARVLSTNQTLLYSGQTIATVEDGFDVTVPITKRAPVLQVCSTPVVLNGRTGTFTVRNRGVGTLRWSTRWLGAQCGNQPCLIFDEASGSLAAGEAEQVLVFAEPLFAGGQAEISTPEGSVTIEVQRP